jgi:uncharacterized membrane protein YadS
MMAGSSLHEVAQVMAAVTPFPDASAIGTVTKLTRVVLLVPTVLVLGWIFSRRRTQGDGVGAGRAPAPAVPKPWFVLGFLLVGVGNTLALHFLPAQTVRIGALNHEMLAVANFLMAMSMAGMGLQVDFARLRANGPRAVGTALLGWAVLASLAAGEIWAMGV